MRILACIFSLCFLVLSSESPAFDIPFPNDEPPARKRLGLTEFDSITKLLHAGKLSPHMKCDLKVRTYKEERRFSNGKKLLELLEIDYYPRGFFWEKHFKILIPAEVATYGTKQVSNQWSGVGEDIKIEAHDRYDHWIRFMHDGKGHLVQFELGNVMGNFPCLVKN